MKAIIDIKTGTGPVTTAGMQLAAYESAEKEKQFPISFDPENHIYHVNGEKVPGVTTIISDSFPLPPIPEDILNRACIFGTAVHAATSLQDAGRLDSELLDPILKPYLNQWERCKQETGMEILENEKLVFSSKHWYAGTLDRKVDWKPKCKRAVIRLFQDSYKIIPFDDPSDFTAFRACLTIYNYKKKENMKCKN